MNYKNTFEIKQQVQKSFTKMPCKKYYLNYMNNYKSLYKKFVRKLKVIFDIQDKHLNHLIKTVKDTK